MTTLFDKLAEIGRTDITVEDVEDGGWRATCGEETRHFSRADIADGVWESWVARLEAPADQKAKKK